MAQRFTDQLLDTTSVKLAKVLIENAMKQKPTTNLGDILRSVKSSNPRVQNAILRVAAALPAAVREKTPNTILAQTELRNIPENLSSAGRAAQLILPKNIFRVIAGETPLFMATVAQPKTVRMRHTGIVRAATTELSSTTPAAVSNPVEPRRLQFQPLRRRHQQLSGKLSKGAVRRLARRGGVKRLAGDCYSDTDKCLRQYLRRIIGDAVTYCEHANRRTVVVNDVMLALKKSGQTLYS